MPETKAPSHAELVERFAHLPVERDTAEHYRGYLRRELVMNRCAACGRWHHPMRPMCPACCQAMPHPPVLVHATATGMVGENTEDQLASLTRHGQHVVVERLKAKSDFWLDNVDLYYPYDGSTIITTAWIENVGWCKPGEASRFLREHWVDAENRVLIDGRLPINSHGGSLSEGGTRGTGHVREAVMQLRGEAGERQVEGARTALVTAGGFFFNSQGTLLRRA